MIQSIPHLRLAVASIFAVTICGCQSVSMPKIDILKTPQFSEEAANVAKGSDFPEVQDAPLEPTDIRSAEQWDNDARTLLALRDGEGRIDTASGPTERQGEAEFERLKAKVQAYKKDDPASGPVQGFPEYKPRR